MCLVLKLKRSLSRIYWLNISDASFPFVGAIEHTNLIPPENYNGKHILYLSNYVSNSDPLYSASAEELLDRYLPSLRRINPDFDLDWVEEMWLYRDDAAQPIITCGYSSRIPPHETPMKGLYLANTTQIYPQDRGMNYSVRLGRTVSELVDQ
jgi:protoporphyrinogen oxidase